MAAPGIRLTSISPEPDATTPLTIRLLGSPTWQAHGRPPVRLSDKDAALLAKLALDGPQPRPALCDLLWPDSTADRSASSLRQRASRLRSAAGQPVFEIGTSVLSSPGVEFDIAHLKASSDEALLETPGLLAGIDLGDHDELDRWLTEARRRVAMALSSELTDRAEAHEQAGRLREALRLAQRALDWTPLTEQGWRRLMRLHYLRGDRAAAQDAYWRLHGLLRQEHGTLPSEETQALFQTIESSSSAPVSRRRPVPVSLLRPPVLVGRRSQWSSMAAAWQAQRPFILVGETGLGKSRLLEAFLQGQAGMVADRARPGDQHASDVLLGRLLLQIEQRFAPPASAATRAELARLRPEFGATPQSPARDQLLLQALETWLACAVGKGLRVIAVDDLQWIDPPSLQTLRWLSLSHALEELRFAFASRPWEREPHGRLLDAWLTDSARPVRVDLQPLSREELSVLLSSLALPALLDEEVASQLYRRAGGHPLYTLATLQHAAASGAELQRPDALGLPDSVQALLDARIQTVPAEARDLLQVAAIGAEDLTVERAADILGRQPLELTEAWKTLEAQGILRGESFSHDLVHDAALRSIPLGVQQILHRQWAQRLEQEAQCAPARIARHWEAGQQWAQAGRCWHAAGASARLAGRLAEQTDLFERSATCFSKADDRNGTFEALMSRLDGLHLRHGGAAVLAALPAAEALADTGLQRRRCHIARAEALLEQGHADAAATEAARALEQAWGRPEYVVDVLAQQAIALALSHRPEQALHSAEQAMGEARSSGVPSALLKAANALMYVHWSAGRIEAAVEAQREELTSAEALGDRATAAASEGSLAALLASAGDVPGTHRHALGARQRQRDCGLSENSTQFILNHTVLGAAAGAMGRYDEALDVLRRAVDLAGPDASNAVRAKARLTLASLWLTLGRPDLARALADDVPQEVGPGMQMQTQWILARAAALDGVSPQRHWSHFDRLHQEHPGLSLVQGADFELSFRGTADQAISRLANARVECQALGLHGLARSLAARELVRWLEVDGEPASRAALDCANHLSGQVGTGLSAKSYVPEAWWALSRAYARAGDAARSSMCRDEARRWLDAAMKRLAPIHRDPFVQRNPVNRMLFGET